MAFSDEPKGAETPSGGFAPNSQGPPSGRDFEHGPDPLPEDPFELPAAPVRSEFEHLPGGDPWSTPAAAVPEPQIAEAVPVSPLDVKGVVDTTPVPAESAVKAGGSGKPPKPPEPPGSSGDDEEEGMAQMSFLEHLEELRKRLLLAVGGVGAAFFLSLFFSNQLWNVVSAPAVDALKRIGVDPPTLAQISPMDVFQIVWMKLPILSAVFLSSPWILYQVWAFIAPGLYRRERRYAAPFVIFSAGLFILGGFFAYFIAFRYGLAFLLGLGLDLHIRPFISVTEYYDLFVDVMLGVGIVFEIPVLLFLLTLIRVVNPGFLVRHSRYAILTIVVLAAIITPTGDVFNLALFATPMILLFYVGIFASYLLVLKRENRRFPWGTFLKWLGISIVLLALVAWLTARYYGYHLVFQWPVFVK
jgi:sec-independent protein translocase protein TatC